MLRLGRCAIVRKQNRRFQHLVKVAHYNNSKGAEVGFVQSVLAGQAARMSLHESTASFSASELQRDDPLAVLDRSEGAAAEQFIVTDRLEEQEDEADAVVLRYVAQVVGDGEDSFVARRDQIGKPSSRSSSASMMPMDPLCEITATGPVLTGLK
jgi:hypothetical protein